MWYIAKHENVTALFGLKNETARSYNRLTRREVFHFVKIIWSLTVGQNRINVARYLAYDSNIKFCVLKLMKSRKYDCVD